MANPSLSLEESAGSESVGAAPADVRAGAPVQQVAKAGSEGAGQTTPRRIIYLDHTASLGGGEIALLNLVTHLDRTRYEPVVVLFSDGPLRARLIEQGVETHFIPLASNVIGARKDSLGLFSLMKIKEVVESIRFVSRLSKFLRTLHGDLVHTNSLKADVLGGLAAKWAGLPVLWHVRDRIDSDYLPPRVAAIFRKLCRFIPDFVIANSAATLETLKLGSGDVGDSVPSGIEVSFRTRVVHDGTGQPQTAPMDPADSSRAPKVILVGRISRWKGQHIFIRAAALVRNLFPATRFQIVGSAMFGEDDYEREIRALAHELKVDDCLEFTGFRNDVPEIIRDSTLVVHASIVGEPFGQVLIEAMAAEKPVVATKGGGVPEVVNDGVTGLLVAMGDAEGMAAAICHLLANPDLAHSMGKYGRQRVLEHFTIQNTVAKMQNIYDDLLDALGKSGGLWTGMRRAILPAKLTSRSGRKLKDKHPEQSAGRIVSHYLSAIAVVALATVGAMLFQRYLGSPAPLAMPFLAAVAICAGFGGTRIGIFSMLLSTLGLAYFVLPPEFDFAVIRQEQPRFIMFLVVSILIIIPVHFMRLAQDRMRLAYLEAEAAHQHMAFIARVTTAFSSSLDYRSTLANIAYVANSALSDWCVIDMLDDVGGRRVLAAHRDPLKRGLVQNLMQLPSQATQDGPVARVIRSGVAELRPVSSPELLQPKGAGELQIQTLKELGSRSHMIVPFLFRGQSLGTITLVSTDSRREYSRDDLRLAVDFAWRSAIALDNASTYHLGRETSASKSALA